MLLLILNLINHNKWLQSNKLAFNLMKTEYIVFHRAKYRNMDIKLCINNVQFNKFTTQNFRSNYW